MDLLERYLQAVGDYLPGKGKQDTLAELRANLMAEMESREEELGRPLNEAEVVQVLQRHGRPVIVASRYLPQHYLIGPGLFPLYWFTLLKSFPMVVLAYAAVQGSIFLFGRGGASQIGAAIGHFPYVAFIFWAVLTLGFAIFEYAQGRYIQQINWAKEWDPRELPEPTTKKKEESFASRVADLIVNALGLAWLLSVPDHPFLVLGPGASLEKMSLSLTPDWHVFYWQIVGLLGLMLVLKAVALFSATRLQHGLQLVCQAVGILILAVMVQAREYLVPLQGGAMPNLQNLASINYGLNLAFKIALAVSVVKFVWDVWQMFVGSRATSHRCVRMF